MHRTHTCWELTSAHVWQIVTLAWRTNKIRNLWDLVFIDMRDKYWVTQLTLDPKKNTTETVESAQSLKNEDVIKVTWEVVARPDTMKNKDMLTWDIELLVTSVEILSRSKVLPFQIVDDPKTSEAERMKYRYLDLRRKKLQDIMAFRARMNHFTRNRFTDEWFLEIQTPLFTVSSPEGSRDFLIPSRVNPWQFYALPQAPQQYKQLLMVGWIDKYFQIAPCFRDEDPRADRAMCEFYQIDLEMSFVEQDDVLQVLEWFSKELVTKLVPHKKITVDYVHLSYEEAMKSYGSDKPDLRFGMKIQDLTAIVSESEFGVFSSSKTVRALVLEWQHMSRKEIDELTEVAKHAWAWWLAYFKITEDWVSSPIAKFLSEKEQSDIVSQTWAKAWDMIFFWAWSEELVCKVLDKVRLALRDKYALANSDHLAFVFIIDFPFYERDEKNESRDFGHNPFSMVVWWKEALESQEPGEIQTNQYDLVLNGYELWSWSIRNNDPDVLVAAFEKIGRDPQEVKDAFGAMYEAFQYWVPPHGWFAFGFDRLMMILLDQDNIRDCYAFPKSWKAQDVMMWAPSRVEKVDLDVLGLSVEESE